MVDDGRHSSQSGKAQSQLRYPRDYPKRITPDLTVDEHHALLGARYVDRLPMAERLRALISLRRQDPALVQAVSTCAQNLLAASPGATSSAAPEPPAETLDPQALPAS